MFCVCVWEECDLLIIVFRALSIFIYIHQIQISYKIKFVVLLLFFFSSPLSVFGERIPLGNPIRSGTPNVPMWTRLTSESRRSAYSLWPPSTGIKGVNYECITARCVCVWERKKKRDRQTDWQTEVGVCLLCFSGRLWTPDHQSSCLILWSASDYRHARHRTSSNSASHKACHTCHFSPLLWPKHWEEQLRVIVLESSPQSLALLIQALGRGRGKGGCSPHCGQGAENTEGTEDQAEPWKLCPSALFPPGRSCLLRLPHGPK